VWAKAVVSSVARPGSETCKTNQILPPAEAVGRGRPTHEETQCAKRTQFRPAVGAHGGNCAKRSQNWGNWSMWAKAFSLCGPARPGSEACKTNPISPRRTRRGWRETPDGVPANGRNCAKRTQFPPGPRRAPERSVQNEPNLGRDAAWGRGSRGVCSGGEIR
jgi:hypothetical protein